jgi:aspartokinase/homoserine dehydrogenase 1
MKVMKFGGTSLKDSARLVRVADIVEAASKDGRLAIVLSAMGGVTDALISCAHLAEAADPEYRSGFQSIRDRHFTALQHLISDAKSPAAAALSELFGELSDILHGVELIGECSAHSLDLITSFGERLICLLFTHFLQSRGIKASMIDARQIIITTDGENHPVHFAKTYERIKKRVGGQRRISIVTGFIASSETGLTTTLGRNGSDYTASLIAAGTDAETIEIWTDVDGVLSADPRYVEGAYVIDELSYEEAMELSYFGAKVLHPYTMIPAFEKDIPIRIKNTFNPAAPGTLISREVKARDRSITGVASIENIALVNVEGGGMMGIPGFAARIFSCLARVHVNIIMISQASSEHTICLVFQQGDVEVAKKALGEEMSEELKAKRIQEFEVLKDLVIIAVIGENMRGTPGISGRLFSALGRKKINVLAIAQGSSERNISFVVSKSDSTEALRCIHNAFLDADASNLDANASNIDADAPHRLRDASKQGVAPR